MTVHVTQHAAERYIERVDGRLSPDQARDAILASSPAIEAAAGFGCRVVKQGCGAKLVLDGETVVTVLPRRGMARDHFRAAA